MKLFICTGKDFSSVETKVQYACCLILGWGLADSVSSSMLFLDLIRKLARFSLKGSVIYNSELECRNRSKFSRPF